MVILKNTARCGIILPGLGELAELKGLVAPGETIEVPDEVADSEYVKNLVNIGEIVEVERIKERKPRIPPTEQ